jgi:hypothetical protein
MITPERKAEIKAERERKKAKAAERKKKLQALLKIGREKFSESLHRLDKDLLAAAKTLAPGEIRYLVDLYYQLQERRTRIESQLRSSETETKIEPNDLFTFFYAHDTVLEANAKKALGVYADEWNVGQWCQSIIGIGPVIASGILAHFDIRDRQYAGHFFSFAGLNPRAVWEKGKKRPWNAALKCLMAYKLGESFVKQQPHPADIYGKIFRKCKDVLTARNERGEMKKYAEEDAARNAITKRLKDDSESVEWWSKGMIRPLRVHEWARRKVVTLFISHLHHAMYLDYYGTAPPKPYVFDHCDGHHDYMPPPHLDIITDGSYKSLKELYAREDSRESGCLKSRNESQETKSDDAE